MRIGLINIRAPRPLAALGSVVRSSRLSHVAIDTVGREAGRDGTLSAARPRSRRPNLRASGCAGIGADRAV